MCNMYYNYHVEDDTLHFTIFHYKLVYRWNRWHTILKKKGGAMCLNS